jgi:battenin
VLLSVQFLPLCMSLTYYVLLPSTLAFSSSPFEAYAFIPDLDSAGEDSDDGEELERCARSPGLTRRVLSNSGMKHPDLTTEEKLALAKPLVVKYMLPLFFGKARYWRSSCLRIDACFSLPPWQSTSPVGPRIPAMLALVAHVFPLRAEYTINSGVAPTLVYEVPDRASAPILAAMIKSLRDYYPCVPPLALSPPLPSPPTPTPSSPPSADSGS